MTLQSRAALGVRGVDVLYGDALGDLPVVPVADISLAELLACAHRRVFRRPAGVVAGGEIHVDGQRLDEPADRRVTVAPAIVERIRTAERPIALVGPGVLDAVAGLHAFAVSASIGVVNTWGAKGVFDWRSPHHLATAGLQARDFELAGFADADLIVTSGVDVAEAPPALWQLAPHFDVAPGALDSVAEVLRRPRATPAVPPLRAVLAAITQEGWASTSTPLMPTKVTQAYAAVFGADGMVAADAGWAGFWVARTFTTTELGGAVVPAVATPGLAAACALVARLRHPYRPVLAVTDEFDTRTEDVLALAATLGAPLGVEVWSDEGAELDAGTHEDRLRDLAAAERPAIAYLATDRAQRDQVVDAAGTVVAWGGLAS